MTREEKVAAFRALHRPGDPVVMPNPWDLGSARLMAAAGAKALATTSSGHAFTLGLTDLGNVTRDQALAHAAGICGVVDVPVNGDFENGYGHDPDTVAETVRLAAQAGLAGVSIEDIALPATDAYPFDQAVARIEAAIAAAREVDIVLTARADGWMHRAYDADEVVRRCRAFADAGAEVIYAPGVAPEIIRELAALGPAVNVLAAGPMSAHSAARIGEMGAARISIGGALAKVMQALILSATREILGGDMSGLAAAAQAREVDGILSA